MGSFVQSQHLHFVTCHKGMAGVVIVGLSIGSHHTILSVQGEPTRGMLGFPDSICWKPLLGIGTSSWRALISRGGLPPTGAHWSQELHVLLWLSSSQLASAPWLETPYQLTSTPSLWSPLEFWTALGAVAICTIKGMIRTSCKLSHMLCNTFVAYSSFITLSKWMCGLVSI